MYPVPVSLNLISVLLYRITLFVRGSGETMANIKAGISHRAPGTCAQIEAYQCLIFKLAMLQQQHIITEHKVNHLCPIEPDENNYFQAPEILVDVLHSRESLASTSSIASVNIPAVLRSPLDVRHLGSS